MPVHISPRPIRATARQLAVPLRAVALRLILAFALAAFTTIALVHGLDSIVLVGAALLLFVGMVLRNTEQVAL